MNLYLFCCILPFSADFCLLGRDFPKAEPKISTFSADFRCLGRDFRTAALGNFTFLTDFRCLGRDVRQAASRNSTFLADFRRLGRENKPHPVKFIMMPMKRGFADKSTETQINIT